MVKIIVRESRVNKKYDAPRPPFLIFCLAKIIRLVSQRVRIINVSARESINIKECLVTNLIFGYSKSKEKARNKQDSPQGAQVIDAGIIIEVRSKNKRDKKMLSIYLD